MRETLQQIAVEEGLSGVLRVDIDGRVAYAGAFGLKHRGHGVPNTIDTQFGLASGAKGFTALTVMSMVERGELRLDTTARSVLGDDLPLIDERVTIGQLLTHTSGIGDYFDEDNYDDTSAYVLKIPVHKLVTTEDYVVALDGYPMKNAPGEKFVYCNGSFVVLALIAERVSDVPFHDLVAERVLAPAGLLDTAYLRSDELPGRAACGYLENDGLRTNMLHLPVRGNGDGGIYSTAADIHALWDAVFAGKIVSPATVAAMVQPRQTSEEMDARYGLGIWLDITTEVVELHGFDAGVGFVSRREPSGRFAYTVISNKGRGAWPVSQRVNALLASTV